MALIKCSECQKEISDKAETCPFCGNPMKSTVPEMVGKVEIEKTNKKWKKLGCLGFILFTISILAFMESISLGIIFSIISLVVIIWARIGAWWNNG